MMPVPSLTRVFMEQRGLFQGMGYLYTTPASSFLWRLAIDAVDGVEDILPCGKDGRDLTSRGQSNVVDRRKTGIDVAQHDYELMRDGCIVEANRDYGVCATDRSRHEGHCSRLDRYAREIDELQAKLSGP